MKVVLAFSLTLFSLNLSGQASFSKFQLSGKVRGLSEKEVYIIYAHNKILYKDSCTIRDGHFSFTGNLPDPVKAYLNLKEDTYNPLHSFGFFLEPGKIKIQLNPADFSKSWIKGSVTQRESERLERLQKPIIKKYQTQIDSLNKETDDEKRNAIRNRLLPFFAAISKVDFDFAAKNPGSFFAAYNLRFHLQSLSVDSLLLYYSLFTPEVKESEFGRYFKSKIDLMKGGAPGSVATGFSKQDIGGNNISLEEFKGKYVLLDFWASWCLPCRKNGPQLRVLYDKYKKTGFEIIGISDNDSSPDVWRLAVKEDNLPWRHVLRGLDVNKKRRNERNEKDIAENFGVAELPTYVLINPRGIIVARYQEDITAIQRDLEKIFGF